MMYRYGLRMRPMQIGAQPKGFLPDSFRSYAGSESDKHLAPDRHGSICYPYQLGEEDVRAYELVFIGVDGK